MMGHMSCRVLGQRHDVWGTVRDEGLPDDPLLSFLDPARRLVGVNTDDLAGLEAVIAQIAPDVVLNCVGIVKQLKAASDAILSISCNALMPHQLAALCAAAGARVVHLSTDCVFSGLRGGYTLDDNPDPVDLYGRSKLLGELADHEGLTIRTSIVGRQIAGATSFFEWILANRGGTVRGFERAIYSGLTTQALAEIIGAIVEDHPQLSGVWQVASEPINKYEIIVALNELLDLGMTIERESDFVLDRSLDGSAFQAETGIIVPSWPSMLEQFAGDQSSYR